jgi:hypothetical protein
MVHDAFGKEGLEHVARASFTWVRGQQHASFSCRMTSVPAFSGALVECYCDRLTLPCHSATSPIARESRTVASTFYCGGYDIFSACCHGQRCAGGDAGAGQHFVCNRFYRWCGLLADFCTITVASGVKVGKRSPAWEAACMCCGLWLSLFLISGGQALP